MHQDFFSVLHHVESPKKPQYDMTTPAFLDKDPLIFLAKIFILAASSPLPFPSILDKLRPCTAQTMGWVYTMHGPNRYLIPLILYFPHNPVHYFESKCHPTR